MIKNNFLKLIIIIFFVSIFHNNSFSISKNFEFIINTIGIPRYNVYYEEINEEIYNKYSVFCYSAPEYLINISGQRFKYTSNGKWLKNNKKGEYYFIGRNYNGNLVANVYFPVDGIPETTPDKWNYLKSIKALNSWNKNNFNNLLQREYMLKSNILFDKIDFNNNTINSYDLVEYNITPLQIGLDKIVMNSPATWKTNGAYTVKRKAWNGKIYSAILACKPIAVDANINSFINCIDNIEINENDDNCILNIKYGSYVKGLNKYTDKNSIKEICSILYINGKQISKITKNKIDRIVKNEVISLNRENYKYSKTYPLSIKVKSYIYTEFYVDGLLQNEINKKIFLNVKEKNKVRSSNLFTVLKENSGIFYLNELPKTNISDCGFIENNRYLGIKIDKNNIENLKYKIYINNKEYKYKLIYSSNLYDIIMLKINEINTLKTWNYLRNNTKNYFKINFNEIGNRIKDKNIITIICDNNKLINYVDTIDDFKINYNYIFRKVNNNKLKKYYLDKMNE